MTDRSIRISESLSQQIDLLRFFGVREGKIVSGNDVIVMALEEFFHRKYDEIKDDPEVSEWVKKRMAELIGS